MKNKILTVWRKRVVGPFSADSANSHHGLFSLVQNANGIAVIAKNVKLKLMFLPSENIIKSRENTRDSDKNV